MPTKAFLRTLIVAEIGLVVTGSIVSSLTESTLPEPLQVFLERESETEMPVVMLATVIPLVLLFLVSSIDLFFFWRPARILYLISAIIGLFLTPFFGPYVDAGWGTIFEDAAIMSSGVILAVVYFSPLKDLYEKPKIAM